MRVSDAGSPPNIPLLATRSPGQEEDVHSW